jgi:hypothetical protein
MGVDVADPLPQPHTIVRRTKDETDIHRMWIMHLLQDRKFMISEKWQRPHNAAFLDESHGTISDRATKFTRLP